MILKLSELFQNCAYNISYDEAGDSVNYKFIEEGSSLYIYFQGSNSTTDWIRNFLFRARPYKDMDVSYKVHRGFLAAWKEVEDIIISKVTEKTESNYKHFKWKKIIIVGYSHGGALAAFCHECVWFWRKDLRDTDNLQTFAFEGPRIYSGWKVKKELEERWKTFTLIRTNNDIVTHCPPFIFRYTHVGNLLEVKGDTSLVDKKWTPKCVKSHYPQVVYDALVKYESNL